jgi:hypothetical protein
MYRVLAALFALSLLCFAAPAAWAQGSFEPNTDRPGGDFARLLKIPSANACQQACVRNRQCAAWTYAQMPRDCWLKKSQPSPVYKADNISGAVRGPAGGGGTGNAGASFESDTDRPGGDIIQLINVGSAQICRQACVSEARCAAWTYAQDRKNCWLKGTRRPPVYKPRNTSGVVR